MLVVYCLDDKMCCDGDGDGTHLAECKCSVEAHTHQGTPCKPHRCCNALTICAMHGTAVGLVMVVALLLWYVCVMNDDDVGGLLFG